MAFGGPPGGGGFGAGPLGGSSAGLTEAESYVSAHGGGTVVVSSQTGAETAIIDSGARVAGIGGFSGRESEVSVRWLAGAVQSGRVRWVLVSDAGGVGGPGADGRVGASKVMSAVAKTGTAVATTSGGTLYDLAGHATALLNMAT